MRIGMLLLFSCLPTQEHERLHRAIKVWEDSYRDSLRMQITEYKKQSEVERLATDRGVYYYLGGADALKAFDAKYHEQ
jgi:hypothetical protein